MMVQELVLQQIIEYEPFSFNGKTLKSQKLTRIITPPVNTGTIIKLHLDLLVFW